MSSFQTLNKWVYFSAANVALITALKKFTLSDKKDSIYYRRAGQTLVSSALQQDLFDCCPLQPSKKGIENMLDIYFGGEIASESSLTDIHDKVLEERVYNYFTAYGFSEKVGMWSINRNLVSEKTKLMIAGEIQTLCESSRTRAKVIIDENKSGLAVAVQQELKLKEHFSGKKDFSSTKQPRITSELKSNSFAIQRAAVHEAGHALLCVSSTNGDLEMVSVQSSSSNLGFVRNSSDLSRSFFTYEDVIENIDITLAGRAAEEVVFGADRVSVGAWGDIEQTTDLAYEVSVLLI